MRGKDQPVHANGLSDESVHMLCSRGGTVEADCQAGSNFSRSGQRPAVRYRRRHLLFGLLGCGLGSAGGCAWPASSGRLELVWGHRGLKPGRLERPRGIVADRKLDRLYIADMTDRIQIFDLDGHFIDFWRLPAFNVDGSTGLSMTADGKLLIADTHLYRVLAYNPVSKQLLAKYGHGYGYRLGQFEYVRDVIEGPDGLYYTCEYGAVVQRIQVFDPQSGRFVRQWGSAGSGPGRFARPEGLAFDPDGKLFVADMCNHRVQVFDRSGRYEGQWGGQGSGRGRLFYPTDIAFDQEGYIYVCEQGNHRVQKFTATGRSRGIWGGPGRAPGRLNFPWGLTVDRYDRVHVADSRNHRVQRIVL